MTTLLALETATEACSCALLHGDDLALREHLAPRRHGDLLLRDCQWLLARAGLTPADLDAVAFGRGPGAFTGLRIAAGAAQGIALAHDLPVLPVSTLAVMARGAHRRLGARRVLVTIDARMGEVYWCAYAIDEQGLPRPLDEERVSDPAHVHLPEGGEWTAVGTGWAAHGEALARATGLDPARARPHWYPSAEDLLPLALTDLQAGRALPAEAAQPVYLRNRVATPGG